MEVRWLCGWWHHLPHLTRFCFFSAERAYLDGVIRFFAAGRRRTFPYNYPKHPRAFVLVCARGRRQGGIIKTNTPPSGHYREVDTIGVILVPVHKSGFPRNRLIAQIKICNLTERKSYG